MKIMLMAFGILKGFMDIDSRRECIYLPLITPIKAVKLRESEPTPLSPSSKKAQFDFMGRFADDKNEIPIYELTDFN